jgi:N-acetylglucosamine-6-phosphate deacetylase
MRAFLYHFHGLGGFDFSDIEPQQLTVVQAAAQERDYEILPTVYLRRENLSRLVEVLKEYHRLEEAGAVPNIAGFAIEGPLLGPRGGIPRAGRWFPNRQEWETIADLGPLGMKYIVIAPDAMELSGDVDDGMSFGDLLRRFYDSEMRIALGHFHRDAPEQSAARLRKVLKFLHGQYESSPFLVLTDHLYNDTPRKFVHAWRTPAERERRSAELKPVLDADWDAGHLDALLGPVPAVMLQAARDDLLFPCLNFDGHHVDLEICRKTVDHLGSDRLIALTDHTEVDSMAKETLHRDEHSPLWLRDDGAVAAGSSGYEQQRVNMLEIGIDETQIDQMFVANPRRAIRHRHLASTHD